MSSCEFSDMMLDMTKQRLGPQVPGPCFSISFGLSAAPVHRNCPFRGNLMKSFVTQMTPAIHTNTPCTVPATRRTTPPSPSATSSPPSKVAQTFHRNRNRNPTPPPKATFIPRSWTYFLPPPPFPSSTPSLPPRLTLSSAKCPL